MSRKVEVDISGLVGNTAVPTIFALSNGVSCAVILTAKTKRELITLWRLERKTDKDFYLRVYISGLIILLSERPNLGLVTIDADVVGHDKKISSSLENNEKISGLSITFSLLGKKSPAHKLALSVYRKEVKANKTISSEEIIKLMFRHKK